MHLGRAPAAEHGAIVRFIDESRERARVVAAVARAVVEAAEDLARRVESAVPAGPAPQKARPGGHARAPAPNDTDEVHPFPHERRAGMALEWPVRAKCHDPVRAARPGPDEV